MDSVLRNVCGKSDARATGRKAARNERDGATGIAAMGVVIDGGSS